MFTVQQESRQYETYILADSASQSEAEIVPERGGILTHWRLQGRELLYLDQERFTHPDLTVRGGIPILFPICGNLPGDTYTHNGQAYSLKQHGFARNLPWRMVNQATDGCAALTVELTSDETTYAMYPFAFQVQFTYELAGHTLTIHQKVTNHSPAPMPFSLGFHPYFSIPATAKDQLNINLPGATLWDHQTRTSQPFTGFDFNQPEIDIAFRPLDGQAATVTRGNLTLKLEYDTPFTTLVFWTVQGKDFYCLEPWTAPRYALTQGDDLTQVAPGETFSTWVRFTAEMG
ncbi:Aldose 1-epimerase [Gloeomargarita lithophora Alchichica-D10]|uniref:Aldose 1-epimerase n=1 Tax=Gloeomargarita lithophora Alchichica-D10 TaxID=1188229 RepID=A0A1J0AG24_9CYAN|nr:DUF4432 family protein [Gloeomargarita lithophora]APB34889.1 Aldose 1-epimerase [Gloeomargarita lithophora Alchichica-D10]